MDDGEVVSTVAEVVAISQAWADKLMADDPCAPRVVIQEFVPPPKKDCKFFKLKAASLLSGRRLLGSSCQLCSWLTWYLLSSVWSGATGPDQS